MKTNIIIDILPLFPHLAKFYFSSYGPKYCWQIKLQESLKCNISRKNRIMFICMQIDFEVFYKLILSFWVWVSRHSQSNQNKKFTYLFNSPTTLGNEVNFLATNKFQNFLQIDNITLSVRILTFPKYPKWHVCNILAISQRKRLWWNRCFACRLTSKVFLNCYHHFVSVTRHA